MNGNTCGVFPTRQKEYGCKKRTIPAIAIRVLRRAHWLEIESACRLIRERSRRRDDRDHGDDSAAG
ncbi:hypothetical protein X777_05267 [Ooceraea biroi]|uniref:Uncharacterized protein n=1 Tax=Ooceraea biroi TaxID=2015173 RepID=A0A026WGL6_OOCBI|nr:hypothetical protein X777_05267 [Ooceraea biroi]